MEQVGSGASYAQQCQCPMAQSGLLLCAACLDVKWRSYWALPSHWCLHRPALVAGGAWAMCRQTLFATCGVGAAHPHCASCMSAAGHNFH